DLDGAAADPHYSFFAPPVAVIAGDPILPREEVEIVGFDVGGPALLDRLLLFGEQLQLQGADDGLRDFVLDRKNVLEVTIVALGPDVIARRAVDQLGVDPDAAGSF